MQLIKTALFVSIIVLIPVCAMAYIGPGLGAGTVGVILGVLGSILIALFAVFWYPFKRLLKKTRENKRKALIWSTGILLLPFACLWYFFPGLHAPLPTNETAGQLFWRSDKKAVESEGNSIRFPVYGDSKYHKYDLKTVEPINLFSLRFDPTREQGTQVYIDYIELHSKNLADPVVYTFNESIEKWKPRNHTSDLTLRDNSLFLQTTGGDPGIVVSNLTIKDLIRIKVKMKVVYPE